MSTNAQLSTISRQIEELAAKLDLKTDYLPKYGTPERNNMDHDMHWFINVAAGGYRLLYFERGTIIAEMMLSSVDELLYKYFCIQTEWMARESSKDSQTDGGDPRIPMGRVQSELLGRLSPGWANRRKTEVAAEIANHPFRRYDPVAAPYYYISPDKQRVLGEPEA